MMKMKVVKAICLVVTVLFGQYSFAQNIVTIAGNGSAVYGPDGLAATATSLGSNPAFEMAIDNAQNIYFTSNGDSKVRKIDGATGIVSTIAEKPKRI
jgi:long-subunit fatty acid transport protein